MVTAALLAAIAGASAAAAAFTPPGYPPGPDIFGRVSEPLEHPYNSNQGWPGTPADHFIINWVGTTVVARIDPIANPGGVAGHVHNVVGSSNFRSVLNTPEEQQQSACSSTIVAGDRSNYWTPTIYFVNENGKFEATSTMSRIYYHTPGYNTQPFPQGMRIISGVANYRNTSEFRNRGVALGCGSQGLGPWLPNGTTHPGGCREIEGSINFPSCGWANQSLDSWDHFSHLTWPVFAGGGRTYLDNWPGVFCPPSHPIKYPQNMLQTLSKLSDDQLKRWRANQVNLILSNGDETGNTFHGDFVAGWDQELQAQTIAQCGNTNGPGTDYSKCPPLNNPVNNKDDAFSCRHQGMIPAEEVGFYRPLDNLPGCNPRWPLNAGPEKPDNCPWHGEEPGWTAPNVWWSDDTHNQEVIIPLAVNLPADANYTLEGLKKYPSAGDNAKLGPWGQDPRIKNTGTVLVGTSADVANNLKASTATNKADSVFGMSDTTPFVGVEPPCVCPLYQTNLNNWNNGQNPRPGDLPAMKVMPVCGAVNSKGDGVPKTGYINGPAPIITGTPNNPPPWEYSWRVGLGIYPGGRDGDLPGWPVWRDGNIGNTIPGRWYWDSPDNSTGLVSNAGTGNASTPTAASTSSSVSGSGTAVVSSSASGSGTAVASSNASGSGTAITSSAAGPGTAVASGSASSSQSGLPGGNLAVKPTEAPFKVVGGAGSNGSYSQPPVSPSLYGGVSSASGSVSSISSGLSTRATAAQTNDASGSGAGAAAGLSTTSPSVATTGAPAAGTPSVISSYTTASAGSPHVGAPHFNNGESPTTSPGTKPGRCRPKHHRGRRSRHRF
ncbi:hypothetical protein Q8F55_006959 [Vanrija albida]|uniref:DUF1996 domain-containing protein n=1 Tax=Vanrija albida TaxID=181172 RepID=A0ABR3PYI6_9TREE